MLLKNNARRLIIINGKQDVPRDKDGNPMGHSFRGDSWKLIPAGPAVEVADYACEYDYVQNMINKGDLAVLAGSTGGQVVDSTASVVDEELEALREEAECLGIKVNKRWKAATLRDKIAEAEEAEQEAVDAPNSEEDGETEAE